MQPPAQIADPPSRDRNLALACKNQRRSPVEVRAYLLGQPQVDRVLSVNADETQRLPALRDLAESPAEQEAALLGHRTHVVVLRS